jgi:hypothetical protein
LKAPSDSNVSAFATSNTAAKHPVGCLRISLPVLMHHLQTDPPRASPFLLADGFAGQFDAIGIVDQPVENAVRHGRIADLHMPFFHRQLTGRDRGAGVVTVLADFQEIPAFLLAQRRHGK